MKNCPKCNASISDTAKFCVKCGFNIKKYEEESSKEYFCAECGTKFSGGTFCPECGYNVAGDLDEKSEPALDNGLSADFSELNKMASEQLFEKEGFVVENSVLMSYNGNKRSIVIHDVEEIYDEAFKNNQLVTFVEINEGVKIIGKKAFANCKSLVKINIPSSCEKVYEDTFEGVKLDTLILSEYNDEIVKLITGKEFCEFNLDIKGYIKESKIGTTIDMKSIFKDIDNKTKEYEAEQKRKEKIAKWSVGNTVSFGKNYINNRDMKWLVLENDGDKALIVSKYLFTNRSYNNIRTKVDWNTCDLRKWINSDFINNAFSDDQQRKIAGTEGYKIFILNSKEIEKYFNTSLKRITYFSEEDDGRGSGGYWWVASNSGSEGTHVLYVDPNGQILTNSVFTVDYCHFFVRPAMWVDVKELIK